MPDSIINPEEATPSPRGTAAATRGFDRLFSPPLSGAGRRAFQRPFMAVAVIRAGAT